MDLERLKEIDADAVIDALLEEARSDILSEAAAAVAYHRAQPHLAAVRVEIDALEIENARLKNAAHAAVEAAEVAQLDQFVARRPGIADPNLTQGAISQEMYDEMHRTQQKMLATQAAEQSLREKHYATARRLAALRTLESNLAGIERPAFDALAVLLSS